MEHLSVGLGDTKWIFAVFVSLALVGCAPSVDEAKEACASLIRENPELGIDDESGRDWGTKDGKRILVYEAKLEMGEMLEGIGLSDRYDRVCVFDGSRVLLPSLLEQGRYLD